MGPRRLLHYCAPLLGCILFHAQCAIIALLVVTGQVARMLMPRKGLWLGHAHKGNQAGGEARTCCAMALSASPAYTGLVDVSSHMMIPSA